MFTGLNTCGKLSLRVLVKWPQVVGCWINVWVERNATCYLARKRLSFFLFRVMMMLKKIAYEMERTRSNFSCFLNVPVKRQMNIMTFTCNILETRVRLCNDSVFMCLRWTFAESKQCLISFDYNYHKVESL